LKGQIIGALDDNLVCILLTGSRIRGEEREDSDYDLAIIIKKIDGKALIQLRDIFSNVMNYSVYLLDDGDLRIG
jgi:predicted nucleotidyltransferase